MCGICGFVGCDVGEGIDSPLVCVTGGDVGLSAQRNDASASADLRTNGASINAGDSESSVAENAHADLLAGERANRDMRVLKRMCDVMAHRGPDGEGQYLGAGVALGHRRLSLIDLDGGQQPLVRKEGKSSADRVCNDAFNNVCAGSKTSTASETDSVPKTSNTGNDSSTFTHGEHVIVFNGEIYNYKDLRTELEAAGWEFETNSDTEVLLVSYLAWGEDALNKLRGMFAFAIWNTATRELFLARDFFGIKPLYYTLVDGCGVDDERVKNARGGADGQANAKAKSENPSKTFIFASEIKSILEHPVYTRELNYEALEQYLCFQFSALDETFFKGIFKLPPATCAHVSADGKMTMRRYWKPDYTRKGEQTFDDAVAEISRVMQESVKYHNVADVEVGSFLSSGIDSSYMAACLAKVNPDIKTFTVGFAEYEGARDEISWAVELADKLNVENANHHITEEEYWESLPRVQWHMDEPSADPSAVALYFVDKLAAEQVKAVLSGEGADEFFAGYKIYQAPLANKKLSWMPRGLLRGASRIFRKAGIRGANYLERASESVRDWYYTNANGVVFSPAERKRLLKPKTAEVGVGCNCAGTEHTHLLKDQTRTNLIPQQLTAPVYDEVQDEDEVQQMQHVDLYFWLVGDILLKTDKMSMAHSLESRVPFLDKRVFEVAASIPTEQKVTEDQTKRPLRAAAETAIPKDWAQKEKLGFPVPVVSWLRQERYQRKVREIFTSETAQKFFNTTELTKLLEEHTTGKDNSRKIWVIYMFLLWYAIYFEGMEME